jgi:hypothetical protein
MRDSEITWGKDDLPELWELAVVEMAIKEFIYLRFSSQADFS